MAKIVNILWFSQLPVGAALFIFGIVNRKEPWSFFVCLAGVALFAIFARGRGKAVDD